MINLFLPQEIQITPYIMERCELWVSETLAFGIEKVDTRVNFTPLEDQLKYIDLFLFLSLCFFLS